MPEGEACGDTKRMGSVRFPKVFDDTFNASVDVTLLCIGARLQVFHFLLLLKVLCLLQSRFRYASVNLALYVSLEAP